MESPEDEMEKVGHSVFVVAMALIAVSTLAAGGPAGRSGDPAGIFVKDRPTPGLELPTIDGRSTINLGALVGRRVIVLQFASW
jgi:hypothetical protein